MPTKTIFISCMQTIGILLVVMGHSFYLHGDHPLCMWIYSFHMPLFFFISGFLFAQSLLKRGMEIQEVSFWGRHGLFFSKFRRLLVPYLLISSLVYLPKVMLSFMAVRPVELSWSSYFSMLSVTSFTNVFNLDKIHLSASVSCSGFLFKSIPSSTLLLLEFYTLTNPLKQNQVQKKKKKLS